MIRGLLFLLLATIAPGVIAACDGKPSSKVVSLQGSMSYDPAGSGNWQPVQLDDELCEGGRVRVEAYSRASLLLPSAIVLRLEEGTVLSLNGLSREQPTVLDLMKGFVHFISRTPKQLKITSPIANAGPEGTEFAMQVDDQQSALWVYEGAVRYYNDQGSMHLEPGQAAQAMPGQAPKAYLTIKPEDAVAWALYYPPLADYSASDASLNGAVQSFRQGWVDAALQTLDAIPAESRSPAFFTTRAAINLFAGRSQAAQQDIQQLLAGNPNHADALSLQAILALTQNRKEQAYQLANQAVSANPNAAWAHSALSYAEQARFDLDKAWQAAEQAVKLAPNDAMLWARKSELELAQGKLGDSRQSAQTALKLDDSLEKTHTVMGFAYLRNMDAGDAIQVFEHAVKLDSSAPLPRMGLGLAKIRKGRFEEGRQDLEIAAILDPEDSSIRSYVGKAYYEEGRSNLAATQLDMAKQMDPKDPTPYLYDALKKQTENRPVEALQDLQKSMELNDNRAINRSQQLLDSDRAARGASLARIYENLGFEQRGTLEAFTAIQDDPTNYSAHRFLADMYVNQPGATSAQLSELLQAKLLQPVNINPVQPHLAVSQRGMLSAAGIANSSFQDYTRVFEGNRPQLIVSGVAGSQGTLGDEATLSGIVDKFSYSLGQYHYQNDGFYRPYGASDSRRNTAQQHDIYDGFVQYAMTDWLNLQFEYINKGVNQGNIEQVLRGRDFERFDKNRLSQESYRSGANISLFDNDHVLLSYIHNSRRGWTDDYGYLMPGVSLSSSVDEVDLYESQYIHEAEKYNILVGYSGYKGTFNSVLSGVPDASQGHGSRFYSYLNYKSIKNLKTIIGLSHDDSNSMVNNADMSGFLPKAGLVWDLNPQVKVRLAGFKEGVRPLGAFLQTIEPTQVAGFNQFIDDGLADKYFWMYAGAVDFKIASNIFSGLEFSRKDKYNYYDDKIFSSLDHVKGYANWAPVDSIALSASYNYFMKHTPRVAFNYLQSLTTHTIPLGIRYFHDSGFFSKLTGTFVAQDGRYSGASAINSNDYENSHFFLVDTAVGYRFPKRLGVVSFEVRNLFDRHYNFQDLTESDSDQFARNSQFIPQRTFFGRITLNF